MHNHSKLHLFSSHTQQKNKQKQMRAQPHVTKVALTIQWDTQHDSPNQSTFCGVPYTRLTRRAYLTTPAAVAARFLPLWRNLLVSLRKASCMSPGADMAAAGAALEGLWAYFQTHDWDLTWRDARVAGAFEFELKAACASLPVACAAKPVIGGAEPTAAELASLFDLFQHYLKTMCLTLPRDATVIQASHHGIQALAGLVAQAKFGQSLQIWEHGGAPFCFCFYSRRGGWRDASIKPPPTQHPLKIQTQHNKHNTKTTLNDSAHARAPDLPRLLQAQPAAAVRQRAAHALTPRRGDGLIPFERPRRAVQCDVQHRVGAVAGDGPQPAHAAAQRPGGRPLPAAAVRVRGAAADGGDAVARVRAQGHHERDPRGGDHRARLRRDRLPARG
jgi:hypothetical protein